MQNQQKDIHSPSLKSDSYWWSDDKKDEIQLFPRNPEIKKCLLLWYALQWYVYILKALLLADIPIPFVQVKVTVAPRKSK